jgi:hypothetical protein
MGPLRTTKDVALGAQLFACALWLFACHGEARSSEGRVPEGGPGLRLDQAARAEAGAVIGQATQEVPRRETALAFTPPVARLRTVVGGEAAQDVRLSGRLAAAARLAVRTIDSVESVTPDVSVLPGEGVEPQGIRVHLTGTRVGRAAGHLVVATGLAEADTLVLPLSWEVDGNLTVEPTNPFLDLAAPHASDGVTVHVSSRRADFRLDDVVVVGGPFAASFSREGGSYAVRVRLDSGRAGAEGHGFSGRLRLVSNDPAEPEKEIPVLAMGAPP